MKYLFIFLFLFAVIPITSQTQDGFKNIPWGTEISSPAFDEFTLIEIERSDDGNSIYYTTNIAILGDVKIKACYFAFYKNIFYLVSIRTDGYVHSRKLLQLWEKAYGDGYQSNKYIERYCWFALGKHSSAIYTMNSVTKDASLLYFSETIREQEKFDTEKKAEDGVSDL